MKSLSGLFVYSEATSKAVTEGAITSGMSGRYFMCHHEGTPIKVPGCNVVTLPFSKQDLFIPLIYFHLCWFD